MEICRARVGELMAVTSCGRGPDADRAPHAVRPRTDEHESQARVAEVPQSESHPDDAGHDVEVAGESESRKRASDDPVDGLGNRCSPRHCGACGARECCNIEVECADTDALGPDAKFQTSTVDLFSSGPRKPTIVNPAVPVGESPCEREAGHVLVFEFLLLVSVFT